MSTLAYTDRNVIAAETAEAKTERKPFWSRLFTAITDSQMRRAEREIGRYLANRGPLTDEIERDIMRRLSGARHL